MKLGPAAAAAELLHADTQRHDKPNSLLFAVLQMESMPFCQRSNICSHNLPNTERKYYCSAIFKVQINVIDGNYLLYQCRRYTTYKISCIITVGYIWLHDSMVKRVYKWSPALTR